MELLSNYFEVKRLNRENFDVKKLHIIELRQALHQRDFFL